MVSTTIEDIAKAHPILTDSEFTTKYPGIVDTITFIEGVRVRPRGKNPYENAGAGNAIEFLEKLKQGDQRAQEYYKSIAGTCGFNDTRPLRGT